MKPLSTPWALSFASAALSGALATAAATGCLSPTSEERIGDDPEDGYAVSDEEKADFLSASAAEYIIQGKTQVVIEAGLANATKEAKEARVRELIGYKQIAIAWFLTQYLVEKSHDDANIGYGGMGGMAKAGSFEDLDVVAKNATTYEFTFKQIVAGGPNLISSLPTALSGGVYSFSLEIGKPSNAQLAQLETNEEWYRQAPWDGWNPANVPASQKEALALTIARETASTDAWFDVNQWLADGVIDIDVHFGWDYHNAYHVLHAKAMYGWLKSVGFTAPVSTFEGLTNQSGPFKRKIKANGKSINVEVRLFYGKSGAANDPDTDEGGKVLEADMRASLKQRDVIIYSGHSGPFYGFALANWRATTEGDLDDSEMASVEMPKDKYQLVVAEGCDTYQIGEAFKGNPAKPGGSLVDVVTTTSFSDASSPETVKDVIRAVIERDSSGRMRPSPIKGLLTNLDGNSWGYNSMYGMHGIDDNPALHPFANLATLGKACAKNADCGDNGNLCVKVSGQSGKRCAALCTADRGCGEGYQCRAIASGASLIGNACIAK